ncbi:transcription factor TFIIIB component B [Nephila pilipes]|uniref:Transcription factor TFIIIB component B n=1 Tax=Nephila pilipes TaxID=299642 RepID=A0A8X6TP30_NEPPI|nr:transcription factor TFIIIB component B [Nephila pilipes]
MASIAMLSPQIKKEPDILPRVSAIPKKKPVLSAVSTRSRFVKARPNISISSNKASKDSPSAPSENGRNGKTNKVNCLSLRKKGMQNLGKTLTFQQQLEFKISSTKGWECSSKKRTSLATQGDAIIIAKQDITRIDNQKSKEIGKLQMEILYFQQEIRNINVKLKNVNVLSAVSTRSRFVKARPNISISSNKASKDSPSAPSENIIPSDNVSQEPVESKPENKQIPVLPKRSTGINVVTRARFQKARPNIGSLISKTSKGSNAQEENEEALDVTDAAKGIAVPSLTYGGSSKGTLLNVIKFNNISHVYRGSKNATKSDNITKTIFQGGHPHLDDNAPGLVYSCAQTWLDEHIMERNISAIV